MLQKVTNTLISPVLRLWVRGLGDRGLSAWELDDQRSPPLGRPALDVLVFARLVYLVLRAHGVSSGAARRLFCQHAPLPSISRQSGFPATAAQLKKQCRDCMQRMCLNRSKLCLLCYQQMRLNFLSCQSPRQQFLYRLVDMLFNLFLLFFQSLFYL